MENKAKLETSSARFTRQKDKPSYLTEIDDDIDGSVNFDVYEKLASEKFLSKSKFYDELNGSDLDVEFFQKNGFTKPILVREKSGLGLRIPSENFSVSDVKRCVGSRRVLDVVDVNTQKGLEMTLKEWVSYYENVEEHKDRLLNVISLEFSHTRLEDYVDQPRVVSELDWVNCAWPWYYKDLQTHSSNVLNTMMYPKVQKYCLMSVGGCYTDFHIDMGGTSVWYHILRGSKVFWLIPPTEENLTLYVNWSLSAKQNDIFFGDIVKTCYRINLEMGWTFFIPTGWIHAVFTPVDSLVFGGNFLHSFGMPLQLGIADIENKTHVPSKFRYPFFKELHWYVIERYVSCLLGIEHRERSQKELQFENGEMEDGEMTSVQETSCKVEHDESIVTPKVESETKLVLDMNVSDCVPLNLMSDDEELTVTSDVVESLPPTDVCQIKSNEAVDNTARDDKMSVAKISNGSETLPVAIVKGSSSDFKQKRLSHLANLSRSTSSSRLTRHEIAGLRAVIVWLDGLPTNKRGVPKDITEPDLLLKDARTLLEAHQHDDHETAVTGEILLKWPPRKQPKRRKSKIDSGDGVKRGTSAVSAATSGNRKRRRVRCKNCEPCTRPDCRECVFCLDLKKYGGPQRMKQTCVSRRCLAPMLARDSICDICNKSDAPQPADVPSSDGREDDDWSGTLLECRVCGELVHPCCLRQRHPETTHAGILDEDYPSSWDCSQCCQRGLQGRFRPRHLKILKSFPDKNARQSLGDNGHSAMRQIHGSTSKRKENFSRPHQKKTPTCSKPKAGNVEESEKKSCGSKEQNDSNSSLDEDDCVQRKVPKATREKRSTSPDWSSGVDEQQFAATRINSRGREITLPRRYLL